MGIGLCELVSLDGRPTSAETVDWRCSRRIRDRGVRGGARGGRARGRAGRGPLRGGRDRSPFLFVICGTGASACLVVDGEPYAGARGQAITLGAPPVERVASGKALAAAAGLERAEDVLEDPSSAALVDEAAAALAQVLAVLANALDPELIVLGGGLGGEPAFRERVAAAFGPLVAYPPVPRAPAVGSRGGRWDRGSGAGGGMPESG